MKQTKCMFLAEKAYSHQQYFYKAKSEVKPTSIY